MTHPPLDGAGVVGRVPDPAGCVIRGATGLARTMATAARERDPEIEDVPTEASPEIVAGVV